MQEGQQSTNASDEAPWQYHPGAGSGQSTPDIQAAGQAPLPAPAAPVPQPEAAAVVPAQPAEAASTYSVEPAAAGAETLEAHPIDPGATAVAWTASEYISHQKGPQWFIILGVVAAVLTALVFLATRDAISAAIIIVAAVIFGVFAARPPRVLHYELHEHGIRIGDKYYGYDLFRSFAVMQQDGVMYADLMPVQRFMPSLSVYFGPEEGGRILDTLAQFLPHEQRNPTLIDQLMHRIRF